MLDQIFGENKFENEIIWKRDHGAQRCRKASAHVHDTILLLHGGAD